MQVKNTFVRIVHAHQFVLKLVWRIDKRRILLDLLERLCNVYEFLVYGALFTQILLTLAAKNMDYDQMLMIIWLGLLPRVVTRLYLLYYTNTAGPVSDVRFQEGMNKLLYEKACQVDLTCFEDSEFYNQYMMAVREAKTRVPKMLHDICNMEIGRAHV